LLINRVMIGCVRWGFLIGHASFAVRVKPT